MAHKCQGYLHVSRILTKEVRKGRTEGRKDGKEGIKGLRKNGWIESKAGGSKRRIQRMISTYQCQRCLKVSRILTKEVRKGRTDGRKGRTEGRTDGRKKVGRRNGIKEERETEKGGRKEGRKELYEGRKELYEGRKE